MHYLKDFPLFSFAGRLFNRIALLSLVLLNPFSLGMLRATCHVSPSNFIAGISEFTLTPVRDNGNCPSSFAGYLVFFGHPTTDPLDGSVYRVGDVYRGATVVANTASVSVTVENGPAMVITPATNYSLPNYYVYGYDSNNNYYGGGNYYGSVTTLSGGGGQKNWSYQMPSSTLGAPSLLPGDEVAASGNDGVLHSMNAITGARRYQPGTRAGTLGYIGRPVQATFSVLASQYLDPAAVTSFGSSCSPSCDVAFLGAQDGTVWAFNAQTGVKLWQSPQLTNLGGSILGAPTVQLRAFSNSAFRNATATPGYDLVMVGTHNANDRTGNKVYALRSDTGAIVWSFAPSNLDQVNSTPMLDYASNTLWVTSDSNGGTQPSIWKLDTVGGGQLQAISLTTSNKDIDCSPTLNFNAAAPYLYVVTNGGDLIAVNTSTNAVSQGPSVGAGTVKYPFVLRNSSGGDDIYFANTKTVNRFTFTYAGKTFANLWTSTVVPNPSTPVPNTFPTPTALYIGGSDGFLYKLNTSDGSKADTRTVRAGSIVGDASIDVALSKIYVGDFSGRVYSYDIF